MAYWSILGSFLLASPAHGADLGAWEGVILQTKAPEQGPPVRFWLDLHARRTGASFVGIVRPAVGWDLGPATTVYAGYAWIAAWSHDGTVQEHRLWQQLITSREVGGATLTLRPRLEERFSQAGPGVGLRLRMFGRAGLPIREPVSISVWDEVFVGLNDVGWNRPGFDQNRAFLGPALALGFGVRVEVGYVNVAMSRPDELSVVHVVATNIFATW